MKTKYLILLSMVTLSGAIIICSCKKEEEKTVTTSDAVYIAQSDVSADASYDDIYTESEDVLSDLESDKYPASVSKKSASSNGTRTITVTKNSGDSTVFPKEIKIVYANYISNSGLKKNGTVLITQSARIRKTGAVRTIKLQDFTINDTIQIEGTKTITNMSAVNNKPSVKIVLENGKITIDNDYYITRSFTRTISWEEGYLTPFYIWDDVYSFDQTAKGSSKNGLSYNSETTVPLEYKTGDFCIKKGKVEVNVEGQKTVVIDFTRTSCLNKIKLSVDGVNLEY